MSFKGKSFKTMKCRGCQEPVEKVDINADSVLCWRCVNASLASCLPPKCEDEEDTKEK